MPEGLSPALCLESKSLLGKETKLMLPPGVSTIGHSQLLLPSGLFSWEQFHPVSLLPLPPVFSCQEHCTYRFHSTPVACVELSLSNGSQTLYDSGLGKYSVILVSNTFPAAAAAGQGTTLQENHCLRPRVGAWRGGHQQTPPHRLKPALS